MDKYIKKCSSGKNSYQNEREAEKAAELGMTLRKGTPSLFYYRCTECYEYHLTSRKPKKKK